jgi:DNA-binding phage protein
MTKEAALTRVKRTSKAQKKAREDFIAALHEAEAAGASWAEIAKAAGAKNRESLYRLAKRNA